MPVGSRSWTDWPVGISSTKPASAQAIHKKSIARRDSTTANVSGPVNSMAMATPSGSVCNAI